MTENTGRLSQYANGYAETTGARQLLDEPAAGSSDTDEEELFTSADLVRALCRLHDADYLREVVRLLQQKLA